MPIIETRRPDIAALAGLHLWHAAMSNCSQRVRLVLEEKLLPWTGHLIDLFTFEHASADYQSIPPKGLVPALVHDGRTIIDSTDIIGYLEREFPSPSLAPTGGQDLVELANDSQLALRTVSHELMLGDIRRLDTATLDRFGREHGNREFFQFLHRFSTDGFDDAHLAGRLDALDSALVLLEARLADRDWLAGATFSLVDIAWVVNVHRLVRIDYPLRRYPRLSTWFARIAARPSYDRALLASETLRPVSRAIQERRERLYARS